MFLEFLKRGGGGFNFSYKNWKVGKIGGVVIKKRGEGITYFHTNLSSVIFL